MTYAAVDMRAFPKLQRWTESVLARPSFAAALAMDAKMMAPRG